MAGVGADYARDKVNFDGVTEKVSNLDSDGKIGEGLGQVKEAARGALDVDETDSSRTLKSEVGFAAVGAAAGSVAPGVGTVAGMGAGAALGKGVAGLGNAAQGVDTGKAVEGLKTAGQGLKEVGVTRPAENFSQMHRNLSEVTSELGGNGEVSTGSTEDTGKIR